MSKYDIYAGLGGEFRNTNMGPNLQMTREFINDAEARSFARELAIGRYQYHEGKPNIMSWADCKEYATYHFPDVQWTFEDITEFYEEEINYLIVYYIKKHEEN